MLMLKKVASITNLRPVDVMLELRILLKVCQYSNFYLRQGDYAFDSVCLPVCLFDR